MRDRVAREAHADARLHHPHAVTVFDIVEDGDGERRLVMEYLPSRSLEDLVAVDGPMEPRTAARSGAAVAQAAAGMVQRDVEPANVRSGHCALGPISFDRFGDTTRRLVTIYSVQGSDFASVVTSG